MTKVKVGDKLLVINDPWGYFYFKNIVTIEEVRDDDYSFKAISWFYNNHIGKDFILVTPENIQKHYFNDRLEKIIK